MKTDSFRGRDFLTLLDWSKEEVETILDVALDLKRRYAIGERHDHILPAKTLFMIFYNQSLRTRNSFEAGMTQLGGHAHYLDPSKIYTPALPGKEVAYSTERVSDVARVLSRALAHGRRHLHPLLRRSRGLGVRWRARDDQELCLLGRHPTAQHGM